MIQQQERIASLCEQLKMACLATGWPGLAQQAAQDEVSFADFLEKLMNRELVAREHRKRATLLKLATTSAVKTLEQFDWNAGSGAPKAQVELAHLAFGERAENVVQLGPSGVGKTHIALALAYRGYGRSQGPLHRRGRSHAEVGRSAPKAALKENFNRAVMAPKLIVIDEIGYLPFVREEANLFFNVVAKRYERGSIVLTSNIPFTRWAGAFADDQTLMATMLDRLLHQAHIIQR